MKKRIISLFVAVTMLLGLMPILSGTVLAANTDDTAGTWKMQFSGDANAEDGVNRIFLVSGEKSVSGKNSLYLKYSSDDTLTQWDTYSNSSLINNTELAAADLTVGAVYNISFCAINLSQGTDSLGANSCMPYIRIGGVRMNPWDTAVFTASTDGLTDTQIADGWKKYSGTVTTTNNTEEFKFVIDRPVECYLDDITVTLGTDTTNTNMLGDGSLDDLEAEITAPEPDKERVLENLTDWTPKFYNKNGLEGESSQDGEKRIFKLAKGESYDGSDAMYIRYESAEALVESWGGYQNNGVGAQLNNLVNKVWSWEANTAYQISFVFKAQKIDGATHDPFIKVFFGDWTQNKTNDTSKISTDGLTEEQIADGWKKYSTTYTTTTTITNMDLFNVQMPGEIWIDDISLMKTSDKTELIPNGSFKGLTYTDGVEDWVLDESIMDGTVNTKKFQTVTGMGHGDDSCMYIEFESSAPDNTTWGYTQDAVVLRNTYRGYDKTNYTLSMWVKGKIGFANTAYIKMGSNQCGKNDYTAENANRYQMSYAVNQTKDAVFEDWTKISLNFTGTTEHFNIWFQTAIDGLYIDDITLTATGDITNTNLIVNGAMLPATDPDPDPEPDPEPTPDAVYTDGVKGWFTETAGSAEVTTNKLQTVTGIGRNDSSCMYVEYDSAATDNGSWGFGNDVLILYNDLDTFDKNKTYTVSLWIKGDIAFSNSSYIWMGDNNADTGADTNKNKFQFNKLHSGAYINASFGEWTQLTATISGATKRFALRFQTDVPGLYIDDVSLVANDDTSKTNLLVNGDIEEMYQQELDAVYTEDFEGWTVSYNKTDASGNAETDNNSTRMVRIANGLAGKDYRSMMIAYDTDRAKDENIWGGTSATWDKYEDSVYVTSNTTIEANKNYVVSFMVKPIDVEYLTVNIGNCTPKSYEGMENLTSELSKEKQDEGWRKYQYTFTATKDQGLRFIVNWKSVWYIDDISVVEEGDESNTNLLSPKQSNFEAPNEDGFYAYKANIYDAEDNLITKLTTAQSGATLTSVATVVNYSCEDDYTAQLITCVYDDEVLIKTAMSARADIPAIGEKILLQNEVKLPEFTEVGNLTVRTYIWDSIKGMIPLQEEVGEI